MIQSEADEYEELDESDPDYAEKHTLLLEAFTDMDKDAHYTGINNGMFMGTLTGPDIRVESMRITAYTPNSYTKKKTMYVTKDGAYVTETPNGRVLAALGRGTEVSAGEAEYHSGIWYSVTFVLTNGNDCSGWIAGIYLSEIKPAGASSKGARSGNQTTSSDGYAFIADLELSEGVIKGWFLGEYNAQGKLLGIYPYYVFKKNDKGVYISDGGITFGYGRVNIETSPVKQH